MTPGAIFAGIYSLIKAVPIFNQWVQSFIEFYTIQRVNEIEAYHSKKEAKIAVVLSQISKAQTHEEKRVLMSVLADIRQL